MKEVVIKISDAMYKYITMEHSICIKEVGDYLFGLVRCTGTLLPKGHGDLKDADKLKNAFIKWSKAVQGSFTDSDIASIVYNSPTIIEADKEGKTK